MYCDYFYCNPSEFHSQRHSSRHPNHRIWDGFITAGWLSKPHKDSLAFCFLCLFLVSSLIACQAVSPYLHPTCLGSFLILANYTPVKQTNNRENIIENKINRKYFKILSLGEKIRWIFIKLWQKWLQNQIHNMLLQALFNSSFFIFLICYRWLKIVALILLFLVQHSCFFVCFFNSQVSSSRIIYFKIIWHTLALGPG